MCFFFKYITKFINKLSCNNSDIIYMFIDEMWNIFYLMFILIICYSFDKEFNWNNTLSFSSKVTNKKVQVSWILKKSFWATFWPIYKNSYSSLTFNSLLVDLELWFMHQIYDEFTKQFKYKFFGILMGFAF